MDRINEWGSHLWTSDSSFAAGQPMGVAQKIARSIGGVGRAMLEFCGIRSRTWATEVEPHECPGNLCMGGGDHEDNEVLPLAAWYSAIKDRAAALLQCLPEEAEWLCACKAWVHRWATVASKLKRECMSGLIAQIHIPFSAFVFKITCMQCCKSLPGIQPSRPDGPRCLKKARQGFAGHEVWMI